MSETAKSDTSWREVAYSLAPPGLTSKTVSGHRREQEALAQLGLDEGGRALIALVLILLVNGGVVLLGVVTTLEDHHQELSKLGQGVTRVVHVSLRLAMLARVSIDEGK